MFNFDTRPRSELRRTIDALYRVAEGESLTPLLDFARLGPAALDAVRADAANLVKAVRQKRSKSGGVDALMREFSLSSEEGVALMCLAEALLRIPDAPTRDALIRDKIGNGDWESHVGQSPSLFVNAATWGLLVTGKLVSTHSTGGLSAALGKLLSRGGEPLIRKGVDLAMRMLGRQFVTGETIEDAIANGASNVARNYRYSYDMLGEAALTQADADGYLSAYEHAIDVIGQHAGAVVGTSSKVRAGAGISVKLSALHPRYARAQRHRVMTQLLPVLKSLALRAKSFDIGLNIDAEEADRLDLSLDLLECLAHDPELYCWSGLGFVIQAYQKRAPAVIDFVADLARRTAPAAQRQMMVRLVKGAYWDSEIKRAQVDGQIDYPVYTRKVHTDVSYQACAAKLLAAADVLYPQFATHNAYTVAWVRQCARDLHVSEADYEFQCLHGMGETLYDQVVDPQVNKGPLTCRIYAPVGSHETLLAYLVRRLLENGANSSFVNRIVDEDVTIDALVTDPLALVEAQAIAPHARIPLPQALFNTSRRNSRGIDFSSEGVLDRMEASMAAYRRTQWMAIPSPAVGAAPMPGLTTVAVVNPADHDDVVGHLTYTDPGAIDAAVARALTAGAPWAATPAAHRADLLRACAQALEAASDELIALAVREAGKTLPNASGEVREAVDFCRYYAWQIETGAPSCAPGSIAPLVCISPWNFPLAIFTGQVMAALAAGRCVLAKPAEQSSLMAARALALFHEAGIDDAVLQLIVGPGDTVGAALVAHPQIGGVLFTGSTSVARSIQSTLSARDDDPVLIAETGGQNAMIVDSSALTEQVVQDVVTSAFDSAGQRCSALRVLCLQEECADAILAMLKGAMRELTVGNPLQLNTDIGPVIDPTAHRALKDYISQRQHDGFAVFDVAGSLEGLTESKGTFVRPTLIEINNVNDLGAEVFGPVLHVLRYPFGQIDRLIDALNNTGYGLTMGAHSRIDENIERVAARAHAGNIYINRNMVGAVVGVQPFGGEGLSGTGPKAGGPLYLARLGGPLGRELPAPSADTAAHPAMTALRNQLLQSAEWNAQDREYLLQYCALMAELSLVGQHCMLQGPTGETNQLSFAGRASIGCVATHPLDLACQVIAVHAVGGIAYVPALGLPPALRTFTRTLTENSAIDALCVAPADERSRLWRCHMMQREGAIVINVRWDRTTRDRASLARLVHEKSVSINTAAAGGNASLMALES